MLYMAQKLNSQTNILAIAINSLLATGALTSNKVMKLLITPSPTFEENRYGIIRDAVEVFIQGKHALFSHLIVSQIESAIRNPVEMSDAPILKSQQVGRGYQLKTLDELLREKCISEIFTFDGALYMQLILTNSKVLNIRNLLCHRIMSPECFGYESAGWLLHTLAVLGR